MLGVNIDDQLKFDNHVSEVSKKVSQQIAVLRRMKRMLPFQIRRDLYLSFIAPHFNHSSETRHFCSKGTTDKLEKINERAIRFVFRDKHTKYEELLRQLGLSTLRFLNAKSYSFHFHKSGVTWPLSAKGLLTSCRKVSYNLRGNNMLILPKPKTTSYGLNWWSYLAAKLWNAIPDSLRTNSNFKVFENNLKDIDFVKFI